MQFKAAIAFYFEHREIKKKKEGKRAFPTVDGNRFGSRINSELLHLKSTYVDELFMALLTVWLLFF